MKNLGQIMKQAQQMQEQMKALQDRLAEQEVTGAAAAGMVTAVVSGKGDLRRLKIDPKLLEPAEAEVLEDLIVAAFGDAKAKSEALVQEEMSKLTGGLQLPPGFMPPF